MKVKRFKTEIYNYEIRKPEIIYKPANRFIYVSGTVINKDFPTSQVWNFGMAH